MYIASELGIVARANIRDTRVKKHARYSLVVP